MCCFDFYVPKSLEFWLVLTEELSKLSTQPLLGETDTCIEKKQEGSTQVVSLNSS